MVFLPPYTQFLGMSAAQSRRDLLTSTSTSTATTTTTTTTTSSPNDANDDLKNIDFDIRRDFFGNSFYTMREFKEKFNRTATIEKPLDRSDIKYPLRKRIEDRLFLPFVPNPNSSPRIIELRGSSPKPLAKTQYTTSNSLGTRTFLPGLVCFVGLLSLVMILIAIGKFAATRCRRKKRTNTETKVDQEACWLTTVLPSAPSPDEISAPLPNASLADPDYPPPAYESLFNVASREEAINERLVINTSTGNRYASEVCARDVENSMPLHPLLSSPELGDGIDLRRHIQK